MKQVVVLAALLLLAGSAFAQTGEQPVNKEADKRYLYQWTDSKGTVHITDGLGKIPERYRDKARKMESSRGQEPGPEQLRAETAPDSDAEEQETEAKAEWRSRMQEWKRRLANAEKERQGLEKERSDLMHALGAISLAPPEYRLRVVEIDRQLKDLETEISTAKDMINNVLPDEARKAGVPPGWLRE